MALPWRERLRVSASTIGAVLLLTVLIPWFLDLGFLDPEIQLFYGCLGPFFLSRPLQEWRPPVAAVIAWIISIAVHALALGVHSYRFDYWLIPDVRFLLGSSIFGFGFTFFTAGLSADWGISAARRTLLLLAVLFALVQSELPEFIRAFIVDALSPPQMLLYGIAGGAVLAGTGFFFWRRAAI